MTGQTINQAMPTAVSSETDRDAKAYVAIVGRPNVGKSTLFNRLVGRREAVVTDIPGTTRDRLMSDVTWEGRTFTVVDTGGLEPPSEDPLKEKVRAQVEMAMDGADLLVFMVDGDEGLHPIDEEIARTLRKMDKPLITVVNKVDNLGREVASAEFFSLGLGEPMLISAYHNLGIHDLMERTIELLPPGQAAPQHEGVPRIAILGRTNVGKSLLMNSVLGEERAIVSEIAGTTRDTLDTPFIFQGRPMVLIDTAGIRRRGQVRPGIERYSVMRALRALDRCDIALLVMDATELATAHDAHIFGFAADAFRGLIAVVNKWDLAPDRDVDGRRDASRAVRNRFHFMPYVPVGFCSALTGEGVEGLLALALDLYQERHRSIPQADLRRTVREALANHPPASTGTKLVHIKEVRQVDVNPPTFLFSVNDPRVHFSYRRYLENRLREAFDFQRTHLRLVFKRTK